MARNRKNQSAAIRFGPALKVLLLFLLIGGSGIGYLWQKDQITRLGQQIRKRELRRDQLATENQKRRKQLADMRSPASLELRIKQLNLGLTPPQPAQICRLFEPLRDQPVTPGESLAPTWPEGAKIARSR